MTSEHQDHTEHIEHATIQVSEAEVTPASRAQARKLAYAVVILFAVTIILLAASFLFQNGQVHQLQATTAQAQRNTEALAKANAVLKKQIQADCGWYRDVSGLPVAPPPMGGRPSIVLPRLISDSRAAWHGHGCPGQIPPADPSFVKWAAFYRLPVN